MTMVMRSRLTVTKSYRIRTCFPIIRRLKNQSCPHDKSADAGTSCSKLDMLYPTIDWQKKQLCSYTIGKKKFADRHTAIP